MNRIGNGRVQKVGWSNLKLWVEWAGFLLRIWGLRMERVGDERGKRY